MALYTMMTKNPNIDTNRVFLFGTSWDADFLSQIIAGKPDLWRGAILFGPGGLPGLSYLHKKKLLIIAGRNDGDAVYS